MSFLLVLENRSELFSDGKIFYCFEVQILNMVAVKALHVCFYQ